jgi:hypothetical protein
MLSVCKMLTNDNVSEAAILKLAVNVGGTTEVYAFRPMICRLACHRTEGFFVFCQGAGMK